MRNTGNITISELSRVTGTPATTIRFYMREGMLPPPERRGKTRAYYGPIHVKRLLDIRKMREKSDLSIREIKEQLASAIRGDEKPEAGEQAPFDRKEDIINAATELFRARGYDNTSLNDIVELAKISKGSFYLHFADKRELFIECADRVFFDIDRKFDDLKNVRDIWQRFRMRGIMFIRTSRHFIEMLHIARGTFTTASPRHRLKLRKIMQNLINPIIHDLDEGVRKGLFKNINTTVVAHMLMGVVEYGTYYLEGKSDDEIEHWIDRSLILLLNGFYLHPGSPGHGKEQVPR
jgi:AcrR family transcriptional regulator